MGELVGWLPIAASALNLTRQPPAGIATFNPAMSRKHLDMQYSQDHRNVQSAAKDLRRQRNHPVDRVEVSWRSHPVGISIALLLALAATTTRADAARVVSVQAVFGLNVNCSTLARRATGGRAGFLERVRNA
jgi:hypothetical protein